MRLYSWLSDQHYFSGWLSGFTPDNGFYLVQIGANDGSTDDPVFSFIKKWNIKGLLIEPNPEVFEKLKTNYNSNSRLAFENLAISDKSGEMNLWRFQPDDQREEWHSLVSTFELGNGFSSFMGAAENWRALPVRAVTLDELVADHEIQKIDLLVTDTEGHDYKILSSFSFLCKPRAIYYEHSNISYNENFSLQEKLIRLGYRLFVEKSNTLAVLKGYHSS